MNAPRGFLALLVACTGAAAGACANTQAPPGTAPDRQPPSVEGTRPASGSAAPGFDGTATLTFDEPIADPRGFDRLVEFSPADEMTIEPKRSGFGFRPRRGWRRDAVYVVTVPPGVRDLLRNATTVPIEWVFSTGESLPDTRVDGRLIDRLTDRGIRSGRVLFLSSDSVPYTAVSDTGGAFRLPSLPSGDYVAYGFVDQNRNRTLDRSFEPWDSAAFALAGPGARAQVTLRAFPPDSTPPALVSATAPDSTILVLTFDDPIDPGASLDSALVRISAITGEERWPISSVRVGEPRPAPEDSAGVPSAESIAPIDSIAATDSIAPADSAGAFPPDSTRRMPAEQTPFVSGDSAAVSSAGDTISMPAKPLPSTSVTVGLARPLAAGEYRVRAAGFPNLRGLYGGGDTTFVFQPAEPSPSPADSVLDAPEEGEGDRR